MSDIVERLRAYRTWTAGEITADPDTAEAADTITALRAEVERLKSDRWLGPWEIIPSDYAHAMDCLRAENEKLTKALERASGDMVRKEPDPDWFWRDLDPDDSGDTIGEALRYMPDNCVCAISTSYKGPSFFAARVPVLDPESDDTEEICAKTEDECLAAVKERLAARAALTEQKERPLTKQEQEVMHGALRASVKKEPPNDR